MRVKTIASIEARMASTRLPGKILAPINGMPSLSRMVRRLRRCERLDGIVVATSTDKSDDAVEAWAKREGVACFRGSHDDVLDRVVGAHRTMKTDVIVELCGDMPLVDPGVVERAIVVFESETCDVVTTTRKPSYPVGIDAQVFRFQALEDVARRIGDPAVREHVSLYFYEHPDTYRIVDLDAPKDCADPTLRLVLDYPEDLLLIDTLYKRLEPAHGEAFGLLEIVALLAREPALRDINRHWEERAPR